MSDELPPSPFVVIDVPLAEDSPQKMFTMAVPVEERDKFAAHLQAGFDVLDDDEDLEFPGTSGLFVHIPKASLALAILQLKGVA